MDNISFFSLSSLWLEQNTVGLCYSQQRELRSLTNHINRFFGNRYINEIKPCEIANMIITLAKRNPNTNKPMAKKTLRALVNTAYRIFDLAVDNDWLTKNPAKNKTKCIPKNAPTKKVTSVNKSIQRMIIDTPHRCRIAALIMMLMGLRSSELLALEWSDLDLEGKRAQINKHTVRTDNNVFDVYPDTKNGKSRCVPIPDNLCECLIMELASEPPKSNYVFPSAHNTLNTPSSWKSAWHSYENTLNWYNTGCQGSKFDPKGYPKTIKITPHQLRHTYATLLYVSDTDVLTASKLLGHSSVQLTLDTYTHLEEEYKTLDITNFNEYLSSDLCKV